LFETDDKPFPFKKSNEEGASNDSHEIVEGEADIVEEVSEEIDETKEVPKEDNLEEDSKS
jgi:hypothetical protein